MRISTQKRTDVIVSEAILIIVSLVFILPLILALTMSIQPPHVVFSFPRRFFLEDFTYKIMLPPFKGSHFSGYF